MNSKEKVDSQLLEEIEQCNLKIKAYKRRWLILIIFIFYSAVNSYQWIEYSSITNIVVKYYNVSSVAVDWTSIIYMALYPFLVIPASYVIDAKGLRAAGLIGCLGTALGTGIKVFSIGQDLFYIVLIGQAIVSASQVVILCLPPKIAAVWFKPSEVSTACALGVFGTQFGCALGFILTPIIVQNHSNPDDVAMNLKVMCWILTISIIPAVIAILVYFPNQPPLPPSITQAEERHNKGDFNVKIFFNSMKMLFLNKGFVIHSAAYGINIGVFSAVGTLLSQFITAYFPNAQEDAGRMGFVLTVAGMIGSIIFGIILDKTHKYKEITFFVYLCSSVSIIALMFALELKSKILCYIANAIVGIFTNAYMPVGFELAMELTYPSEECTTTGLLMAITQVLGVLFAVGLGYLNILVGPFWSLASQAILLVIGTIVTGFVPNELKRQAAFNKNKFNTNITKFEALPQKDKDALRI